MPPVLQNSEGGQEDKDELAKQAMTDCKQQLNTARVVLAALEASPGMMTNEVAEWKAKVALLEKKAEALRPMPTRVKAATDRAETASRKLTKLQAEYDFAVETIKPKRV